MMMSGTTTEQEEELFQWTLQLSTCSVTAAALRTAVDLRIIDIIIKEKCLSPLEIASRIVPRVKNLDTSAAMLDRLMRLLACHSVLTCSSRDLPDGKCERLYSVGPLGELFANKDDQASFANLNLHVTHRAMTQNWYNVKDAIIEGGYPVKNTAEGMTLYEYAVKDESYNKIFNKVMHITTIGIMNEILKLYNGFEGINSLVDVGGGTGTVAAMIASKYTSLSLINFDLPHVIADAPPLPGVEHVGGDMFVSIPKADAIFMKFICHNWNDERCLKFLKNCYNSMPENGKVIVVDIIFPNGPFIANDFDMKRAVQFDVIMFVNLCDGKERTMKEFEALAKASDFQGFQVVCSSFGVHVMEFLKQT